MAKSFGNWKPGQVIDYSGGAKQDSLWGNYGGGSALGPRCYESHPALKVGDKLIYGGSCISPVVKDADIYIGLDHGMTQSYDAYPWNESKVVEVFFPIVDRNIPKNPAEFRKMIDWICNQLHSDKKVHVGCIGGHGRTGMVLSAVVNVMTGEKDAVTYVRDNYCKKAVETSGQIDFLNKQFGITKAKGSDADKFKGTSSGRWSSSEPVPSTKSGGSATLFNERYGFKELEEVKPVASRGNIWGEADPSLLCFDKVG